MRIKDFFRRFTITELSTIVTIVTQLSRNSCCSEKLCARWVPKQLTREHKAERMESPLTFVQRCSDDGEEFLDRVITGDETWVPHTPEKKAAVIALAS